MTYSKNFGSILSTQWLIWGRTVGAAFPKFFHWRKKSTVKIWTVYILVYYYLYFMVGWQKFSTIFDTTCRFLIHNRISMAQILLTLVAFSGKFGILFRWQQITLTLIEISTKLHWHSHHKSSSFIGDIMYWTHAPTSSKFWCLRLAINSALCSHRSRIT